ncbi:Putative beta-glucosidase 23 [Dendrobium catenatum]|uniref:Beta-glucosidase 23 n=1 Tax=Dendrobium catenatum TaxID=906689 RepID=A0A2I0VD09_9ASPA|nr:Putative beta-glucosidase 23 [Dendrobium catenatum]
MAGSLPLFCAPSVSSWCCSRGWFVPFCWVLVPVPCIASSGSSLVVFPWLLLPGSYVVFWVLFWHEYRAVWVLVWCDFWTEFWIDFWPSIFHDLLGLISGWYCGSRILNPLVFGDYPEIMKKNAGSRLPSFTSFESQQVKGSYDFIGLNYYYALYATYDPNISKADLRDITLDMFAKFTGFGFGVVDTINDLGRISFLSGFIGSVLDSIRDGSDVRGYFIWAFLDVYEWITGLTERFGLYHVNFEDTELERTPRLSADWYRNFLKDGGKIMIEKLCQQRAKAQSSQ